MMRRPLLAMRAIARTTLVAAAAVALSAHVGSPTAFFAGKAGSYDVTVIVRPPEVVPGLADVTVKIPAQQAATVTSVVVRPVFWNTGSAGSPAGDEAVRVAGPEPMYAGKLWLMRGGSYSVYVTVAGAAGGGTVTVPVAAVATAQLPLGGGLKVTLIVLGLVLFVGMLTIVHRAAGESLVPSGADVPAARRRGARLATAVALPLLLAALLGGWTWWQSEAEAYRRTLYKPWSVRTEVLDAPGGRALTLTILDEAWRRGAVTPIMPDHGKLMHMFVIREPALDVFAHLHPAMKDSNSFEAALPPLPPGRYRVYADVVHESGFARTIVDTLDLGESAMSALRPLDADDAWAQVTNAPRYTSGAATRIDASRTLVALDAPATLVAGAPVDLRFRLDGPDGTPLPLEYYLGMPGHAVVASADGSVYIHLHPSGTVAAAAQQAFELRERGDTTETGRLNIAGDPHAGHQMTAPSGIVAFPYEFPKAGRYRVFVQVKHGGTVHTAAFDATVEAPAMTSK